MGTATLTIDLDAIAANWRSLDRKSAPTVETAAVVKADGYGLGADRVARTLAAAGARTFFVAAAEEAIKVRAAVGPGPEIRVFSGHMERDTALIADLELMPMLNSVDQVTRHLQSLGDRPFGIQLDTGMNRLGLEPADWGTVRETVLARSPRLVMSHLACADDPGDPMNARQKAVFDDMTRGLSVPRSLAATGGILLDETYHYDMTRPGVGLYGGAPFTDARFAVRVEVPVIQVRSLDPGETAGYGNSWTAARPTRLATVAAGYADGIPRSISNRATLYADGQPCPLVGRVSMDLITVDVTDLAEIPGHLEFLGPSQGVDALAEVAGTIGYEILTSLGRRYRRRYEGGP